MGIHCLQYLAKKTYLWLILGFLFFFCLHSSLLHHPLLCLSMDPLCLFLLWRKGWRQLEQMLGKNAPFFFYTRLCSLLWCSSEKFKFHSDDSGVADQYVNDQRLGVMSVELPSQLKATWTFFFAPILKFYMTDNESILPFLFSQKLLWILHDPSQYTHVKSGFISTVHDRLYVSTVILLQCFVWCFVSIWFPGTKETTSSPIIEFVYLEL